MPTLTLNLLLDPGQPVVPILKWSICKGFAQFVSLKALEFNKGLCYAISGLR